MKLYSVVLSVYLKDDHEQFAIALASLINQSVRPSEIVVVVDGPVGANINEVLKKNEDNPIIRQIRLNENVGLGPARHAGIEQCKFDIVAVMDSDDISVSNRFELQLQALDLDGLDIVGGYIEEFDQTPKDHPRIRVVPLSHNDILARGNWRSPMNHVTVMFRREAYYKSGGYKNFRYVEDYDLFYRMLIAGVRFGNLDEILVYVRSGRSMVQRRTGVRYLLAELALLGRMRRSGFINFPIWLLSVWIRIFVRLSPNFISLFIYKFLRTAPR
jgi:glycosyltransferase involved in cell wall biosynthesis